MYEKLQEIFGIAFPVSETIQKAELSSFAYRSASSVATTEQFIEHMFPVDIKYSLKIECEVSAKGFREGLLRVFIRNKKPLLLARKLRFYIKENEFQEKHKDMPIPIPFDIYCKLCNQGQEAIKRNCIRGQIKERTSQIEESTDFIGGHFVECYIIN